jgi:hypothetical protein
MAETADALDGDRVARMPALRIALKTVMPAQSRGAASAAGRFSGIAATASAGAIMYSEYPPSKFIPVTFSFSQLMKSPRRQ